jgi:hypothetical protein
MTGCVNLGLDAEALRPLLREIVAEVLAQVEEDRARVASRLAYSEAEASALIGLRPHQLRDERRRGRIGASVVVGGKIRYLPSDLTAYLAERRVCATAKAAA